MSEKKGAPNFRQNFHSVWAVSTRSPALLLSFGYLHVQCVRQNVVLLSYVGKVAECQNILNSSGFSFAIFLHQNKLSVIVKLVRSHRCQDGKTQKVFC